MLLKPLFLLAPAVFCVPFGCVSAHAQDVPRLALNVQEKLPVAAGFVRRTATSGLVCDGAGNVYFQGIAPAPARNLAPPIVRISADGRKVTKFSLSSAPGLAPDASTESFAVTPRGEVFALGYNGQTPALFTFRDDGQFDSLRTFDREISSSNFAVFATGEFLVRGSESGGPANPRGQEIFTGLFDRNGRFLKPITVQDEIKFPDRAAFKDKADYYHAVNATLGKLAFSQAISGDRGRRAHAGTCFGTIGVACRASIIDSSVDHRFCGPRLVSWFSRWRVFDEQLEILLAALLGFTVPSQRKDAEYKTGGPRPTGTQLAGP